MQKLDVYYQKNVAEKILYLFTSTIDSQGDGIDRLSVASRLN